MLLFFAALWRPAPGVREVGRIRGLVFIQAFGTFDHGVTISFAPQIDEAWRMVAVHSFAGRGGLLGVISRDGSRNFSPPLDLSELKVDSLHESMKSQHHLIYAESPLLLTFTCEDDKLELDLMFVLKTKRLSKSSDRARTAQA